MLERFILYGKKILTLYIHHVNSVKSPYTNDTCQCLEFRHFVKETELEGGNDECNALITVTALICNVV